MDIQDATTILTQKEPPELYDLVESALFSAENRWQIIQTHWSYTRHPSLVQD